MSAITAPHDHASSGRPAPIDDQSFPRLADRLSRWGLVAGGLGVVLTVGAGFVVPGIIYPAYLCVYLFFLGFGVGSLGLLLLHQLVGGLWGFIIRRPLEAAASTLPFMALLFLPILFGVKTLYPWTDAAYVAAHPVVAKKAAYLSLGFWSARAVLYHLIWSGLALYFRANSAAQDATDDPAPGRRNQILAAPGLILLFLSVTFSMVDWGMSTEPEWYSSIYGVMLLIGFALSGLALAIVVASNLRGVSALARVITAEGLNDLGNLLLAFTMLWAYMSFSQYLIIWMGNLAEEVPWYIERSYGAWQLVCGGLIVLHFFLPFFLLLVRDTKRDASKVWKVAAFLALMQLVNDVWLIVPAYQSPHWAILLAVPLAVAALGGVFLWAYARELASRPLMPLHDPMLAGVLESVAHKGHGGGN